MADPIGDRTGQQLGNYRLLRLLGRGGFAEVYLGQHIYLNSQAALKVLQIALNDEDIEHFAKEARTLASLTHPHIVRVLDFAVENGTPFLVMEYAANGTLRQLHPQGPRISQRGCGRANPDVMSESHAEPDVELVRENRNRGMESKKGRGWEELRNSQT